MTRLIPAFAFNVKTGQYEILNANEIAFLKKDYHCWIEYLHTCSCIGCCIFRRFPESFEIKDSRTKDCRIKLKEPVT